MAKIRNLAVLCAIALLMSHISARADELSTFDNMLSECISFVAAQDGASLEYVSTGPENAPITSHGSRREDTDHITTLFENNKTGQILGNQDTWSCRSWPTNQQAWDFLPSYMSPERQNFLLIREQATESYIRWRYIICTDVDYPMEINFEWYPREIGGPWSFSAQTPALENNC